MLVLYHPVLLLFSIPRQAYKDEPEVLERKTIETVNITLLK